MWYLFNLNTMKLVTRKELTILPMSDVVISLTTSTTLLKPGTRPISTSRLVVKASERLAALPRRRMIMKYINTALD